MRGGAGAEWIQWRHVPATPDQPALIELILSEPSEPGVMHQLATVVEQLLTSGATRIEARVPLESATLLAASVPAGLRREGVVRSPTGRDLALLGRLAGDVDPGADALPTIASAMPTVLRAAGWYLRDPRGRVLMVDPVYKAGLDLPGGICEVGEDLRMGARRELVEELGLTLDPGDLLVLDFALANGRRGDIELGVLDGGVHSPEFIEGLTFPDGELAAAHWVHPDDLDGVCPDSLARRIRAAHKGFAVGQLPGPTIVLRDGYPA